jgi:transcriptional regulator with XRE-family HTH domain
METNVARRRKLGLRLRAARLERGFSQHELAAKVGVSQANVSRWEGGHLAPDIFHMEQLARHLARPVLDIFAGQATLPGDQSTLSQELSWWGLDLLVDRDATLWAVRGVEEVLVSALVTPDPRVIDRLAALFFLHPSMRPDLLWGHADAHRVQQRLGWLIDVAREIVAHGREHSTDALRDPRPERLVAERRDRWSWDSLGSPAENRAGLGPIWQRWRVDYDRRFVSLVACVVEVLEHARGA